MQNLAVLSEVACMKCMQGFLPHLWLFRSVQAIQAGGLANELPDFATPSTAFAPVNSAFYDIVTGTGQPPSLTLCIFCSCSCLHEPPGQLYTCRNSEILLMSLLPFGLVKCLS